MTLSFRHLYFVVCVFASVSQFSCEHTQELVATIGEVKGEVQIKRQSATEWIKASNGMELYRGDKIRTGPDGYAFIKSTTGGMMRMVPNTTFHLDVELDKLYRKDHQPVPPEMEKSFMNIEDT